jgi:Phosphotransferase enzyme family
VSSLLARLDAELGGGPRDWSDVTIVRNVGPLAAARPLPGDNISNRGFNAIVHTPGVGATHFAKIRPLAHTEFEREVDWALYLAGHQATGALVPASTAFTAGPARVLLERYVEGTSLDVWIRSRQRTQAWFGAAAQALRLLEPLSLALAAHTPPDHGKAADLSSLADDLQLLVSIGLDAGAASALQASLSAAPLGLTPQHGDFWPRNVLVTAAGLKLIDFELCGEIRIPLYDAFHMIRGCGEAAGETNGRWLESWAGGNDAARPLTDVFQRIVGGMGLPEVEAALVSYLVDFAARLHRRGVSRERTASRVRELARMPPLLQSGLLQQLMPKLASR